jgi:uncharacterized protein (TIRG00374 family)
MKKIYLSLIGVVLIIAMIWHIGIDKIFITVKDSNYFYIILALIVNLICLVIRSFRWGFIIDKLNDFKNNFIVKMIGLFAANITPVRSGGEVFTAVAGKEINGISLANGLSAGFIERLFDGVIAFLLLFACNFLISGNLLSQSSNQPILLMGTIATFGFLVFIYLFNWKEGFNVYIYNIFHSIIKFLPISKKFLDKIYSKMTSGLNDMVGYSKEFSSAKNLIVVFLLSLTPWLLECLRLYLVLMAFNIPIPFMGVVFIFFMADIVGIVSILPGGMGSFDVMAALLLSSSFGVSSSIAGTAILVDRLLSYWFINLIGMLFTLHYTEDIFESLKNN